MSSYNFKSSPSGRTPKNENKKYNFAPTRKCSKVIKKKSDSTVMRNVNNIMRFDKDGNK